MTEADATVAITPCSEPPSAPAPYHCRTESSPTDIVLEAARQIAEAESEYKDAKRKLDGFIEYEESLKE